MSDTFHFWPKALYSTEQSKRLDSLATQKYGLLAFDLMRKAGLATYNTLKKKWPLSRKIVVICGGGNNGGDGFVVAKLAHAEKLEVQVLTVSEPERLSGIARLAYDEMQKAGLESQPFTPELMAPADVVVDAIFGTGLDRVVTGLAASAIKSINQNPAFVLSIDVPSGLSADTGDVLGVAVQADVTVTFIGLKQGLFTGFGPDLVGELVFDGLSVPPDLYNEVLPSAEILTLENEIKKLSPRKKNSNKGSFGRVLIGGGDHGMTGAVQLAGEAALRSGAGLVKIATRRDLAPLLNLRRPELMCFGEETSAGIEVLLSGSTVAALGPGLGRSAWAAKFFEKFIESSLPLVVDADGLNLLAEQPVMRGNWILTPHPGEAARLLQATVADVQANRFAAVTELQKCYGGVAILKGCGTLICDEAQGPVAICPYGNPGMATAGMGDVLTGVIVGLLAQGLSFADAARLGVCLHAKAGDLAADQDGAVGMMASDLFMPIRHLLRGTIFIQNPMAS